MDRDQVKALILEAFAMVERPGNWALAGSSEGDEPQRLEQEFRDKEDWRSIDPAFLDQAPGGLGSALSFFSDEAFRYFLPAYLIADLDGKLDNVDPVFSLTNGLDDASASKKVNPRRYGARTWMEAKRHRFSVFTPAEASAIVAYLRVRAEGDEFERRSIEQAIEGYWKERGRSTS
jgi:hypothetical protein